MMQCKKFGRRRAGILPAANPKPMKRWNMETRTGIMIRRDVGAGFAVFRKIDFGPRARWGQCSD
jgi:hypothetical protein